jgi:hypothetical protein
VVPPKLLNDSGPRSRSRLAGFLESAETMQRLRSCQERLGAQGTHRISGKHRICENERLGPGTSRDRRESQEGVDPPPRPRKHRTALQRGTGLGLRERESFQIDRRMRQLGSDRVREDVAVKVDGGRAKPRAQPAGGCPIPREARGVADGEIVHEVEAAGESGRRGRLRRLLRGRVVAGEREARGQIKRARRQQSTLVAGFLEVPDGVRRAGEKPCRIVGEIAEVGVREELAAEKRRDRVLVDGRRVEPGFDQQDHVALPELSEDSNQRGSDEAPVTRRDGLSAHGRQARDDVGQAAKIPVLRGHRERRRGGKPGHAARFAKVHQIPGLGRRLHPPTRRSKDHNAHSPELDVGVGEDALHESAVAELDHALDGAHVRKLSLCGLEQPGTGGCAIPGLLVMQGDRQWICLADALEPDCGRPVGRMAALRGEHRIGGIAEQRVPKGVLRRAGEPRRRRGLDHLPRDERLGPFVGVRNERPHRLHPEAVPEDTRRAQDLAGLVLQPGQP